jgi:hypothetical protein
LRNTKTKKEAPQEIQLGIASIRPDGAVQAFNSLGRKIGERPSREKARERAIRGTASAMVVRSGK